MAKKVVVTGANGHVGTALTKELLEHGYDVIATVRDAEDPSRTNHLHEIANSLGASERFSIRSADLMKNPPLLQSRLERHHNVSQLPASVE